MRPSRAQTGLWAERAAEAYLLQAAAQPGYALAVLTLVSQPLADASIRQAAAVHFKVRI